MTNIVLEKPRPLAEVAPGTPLEVQAVIERMLQKEVDARYQTMEEVLMDLEPIWRKLQQDDVSQLLANGQQIFEAGDLENARAKLSSKLHLPINTSFVLDCFPPKRTINQSHSPLRYGRADAAVPRRSSMGLISGFDMNSFQISPVRWFSIMTVIGA